MYFRIIIPNYNNGEWIGKTLQSVMDQTFKDYQVIVVDDMSTDNSVDIIKQFPVTLIQAEKKSYNGGARNIAIKFPLDSEYTLFLDSDDWLEDENRFQMIYDALISTSKPDCLSMAYRWISHNNRTIQSYQRDTRRDLVNSCFVACWTKCIKSEKIVLFPENTLFEDVVQHIAQADVLDTFATMVQPVVNWNRNNANSVTANGNLHNKKWRASIFRYVGELIEMELNTPECRAQRDFRIKAILQDIKRGEYG